MTNPNNSLDGSSDNGGEDFNILDPYIPASWFDEPGFMSAKRLELTEDIDQRLAEHDPSRFRTELRTVPVGGVELKYVVMFLKVER